MVSVDAFTSSAHGTDCHRDVVASRRRRCIYRMPFERDWSVDVFSRLEKQHYSPIRGVTDGITSGERRESGDGI
jgi:hypothetical protein